MSNNRKIDAYFKHHKAEKSIDDITFNDLNLSDVFDRINKTSTSLGEEVLYNALRNPKQGVSELNNLEDRIKLLNDNSVLCSNIKKRFNELNKLKNISIFEYLYLLDEVAPVSNIALLINPLIMIISIFCLFFLAKVGIYLFVVCFIFNTIKYFEKTAKIKPYIISFAYINKAINVGNSIELIDKEETALFKGITKFTFILGNLSGVTANGGSGNPFDLVLDLLKMGFHLDVIKFYRMLNTVKKYKNEIENYLYHIGSIDMDISILEYRKEIIDYCVPTFVDDRRILINDLYHPLLKDPVKNNIDTSKSILVTGSNASGKSTFLRACAISVIMAQSINTVLASSYKAPIFTVLSCMDISDSVIDGDSYYMSEIKAVKRIVDMSSSLISDCYILCFIDELLKGTNTVERISAGSKILEFINNDKTLCFAATHDRELTKLLEDKYDNYHFEENLVGEDISFSYKLMDGPSTTTNAISLLKEVGFPNSIIEEAKDLSLSLRL